MQSVEAEQGRRELASGERRFRFEEAVNAILEFVDSDKYPTTLHPISIDVYIDEANLNEGRLREIFTPPVHMNAERKFYRQLEKKVAVSLETEELVTTIREGAEFLPAAVAYAAGLRAAGLPKETARAILARYLCAFDNDR